MRIGALKEIIRHPVKSFRGENVLKTKVVSYGLYGDRSHAFLDEKRPGKYLTLTQVPELANYHAIFVGEESLDRFPSIKIQSPSGSSFQWEDVKLAEELEELSGRKVKPVQYSPDYVPFGAIEEEHILITTEASLLKMSEIWGKQVDYRRFRPNLVLSLNEHEPFIEETWFGKRMQIGEAEIIVKRHCERCQIINIDPETGLSDPTLLKTVYKERHNCFGVYASVVKTGNIAVGDSISLFD
ncbi:MOSC domain-containing protein [Robertmurraya massiliosenegalensis]|uniref:MOSC domain-containing protein n=1 Tax=Robertmurraya massiliosenegalensis TaxID=1287657 RepID=UPI0002DB1C3A|nr:MOSC domain-containing protein [Robertmurraya massiliosenegalensis]